MNSSTTSLAAPIEQAVVLRSLDEDGSASGWSLLLTAGIVLAISTRSAEAIPQPQPEGPVLARLSSACTRSSQPRSRLGAALRARREAILNSGAQTLGWDEIEREVSERGGEAQAD
ncbi:MAG: hypothetical protein HYY18_10885 [Planctomycetes bacterium]|nr:hypothetical protein [Planctomycetota bacterium]